MIGDDDTFIVGRGKVLEGEEDIFISFLPDRMMGGYHTPDDTGYCVFYPFVHGHKLTEEELCLSFCKTWSYLESNRASLKKRLTVRKGELCWWAPTRPRVQRNLLRPKIVSSHLVLVPRFSLDKKGVYAVSRAPFIVARDVAPEEDLLKHLLAVLNSSICGWFLSSHSH